MSYGAEIMEEMMIESMARGEIRRQRSRVERSNKMDKIKNVGLKVVGVTFTNEDGSSRRAIIEKMNDNSKVYLVREPSNKYDVNAIKVCAVDADGHDGQIGYIGKDYSAILAPMMDMGREFTAEVDDCGIYKDRPYCNIIVNEK